MTRSTALAASTAVALVILAGGAAVATSGLGGGGAEPAGELSPLDPVSDGTTTVIVEVSPDPASGDGAPPIATDDGREEAGYEGDEHEVDEHEDEDEDDEDEDRGRDDDD